MTLRNESVAQAWLSSRAAHSGHLSTDGYELRSYGWHVIGVTEPAGSKLLYCCHYSRTTQGQHVASVRWLDSALLVIRPCPSDNLHHARYWCSWCKPWLPPCESKLQPIREPKPKAQRLHVPPRYPHLSHDDLTTLLFS